MVGFNPQVIASRADSYETRAGFVQVAGFFAGVFCGAGMVSLAHRFFPIQKQAPNTLLVFAIGAAVPFVIADVIAARLRFQAQMLRLQLQIEENTRHLATIASALARAFPQAFI